MFSVLGTGAFEIAALASEGLDSGSRESGVLSITLPAPAKPACQYPGGGRTVRRGSRLVAHGQRCWNLRRRALRLQLGRRLQRSVLRLEAGEGDRLGGRRRREWPVLGRLGSRGWLDQRWGLSHWCFCVVSGALPAARSSMISRFGLSSREVVDSTAASRSSTTRVTSGCGSATRIWRTK